MKIFIFLFVVMISACASNPTTPDGYVDSYLDRIKELHQKKYFDLIPSQFNLIAEYKIAPEKVKLYFSKNPQVLKDYIDYLSVRAANVDSPFVLSLIYKNIVTLESVGGITQVKSAEVKSLLDRVAAEKNLSDELKLTHSDDFSMFPSLNTNVQINKITERTIDYLQKNAKDRSQLVGLIKYLETLDKKSDIVDEVGKLLPTMNIKKSEIAVIQNLYPDYAKIRLQQLAFKVFLRTIGMDRLASDDIARSIKSNFLGIDFVTVADDAHLILSIEKARHEEKSLPEKTETITYSYTDVDFFKAALLMPKNASYLYDVVKTGNDLEYGYIVSVTGKGVVPIENVVRGKFSSESYKCQNIRIQNVFGGVSSASFVANDHMEKKCAGGNLLSMDELRAKVVREVVKSIADVPSIQLSTQSY